MLGLHFWGWYWPLNKWQMTLAGLLLHGLYNTQQDIGFGNEQAHCQ